MFCAVNWWLRSPNASSSANFANVNNNGNANSNNATNSNGVSFGFPLDRPSTERESISQGEKESMTVLRREPRVNIFLDVSGRTLLAWYGDGGLACISCPVTLRAYRPARGVQGRTPKGQEEE